MDLNGHVSDNVDADRAPHSRTSRMREWVVALALVGCVILVAVWELMANQSRAPFRPFLLTSSKFSSFTPSSRDWRFRPFPIQSDPIEPNILLFEMTRRSSAARPDVASNGSNQAGEAQSKRVGFPIIVRLVHGYNMCDCMRIKGYKVDPLLDFRESVGQVRRNASEPDLLDRVQVWRLVSPVGDVSIWVSSMLRAGDFSKTDVDVRSLAFPRVGVADDPGWLPRGMTLKSLRHPIRNFRLYLRAAWNNARCDWATFLKLRQPAWASDELLTLVAHSSQQSIRAGDEADAVMEVLSAHHQMYIQLGQWQRQAMVDAPPYKGKGENP